MEAKRANFKIAFQKDRLKCTCPKTCDCEYPPPYPGAIGGVWLVSNECPIHNEHPQPSPDCPIHGEQGYFDADHIIEHLKKIMSRVKRRYNIK